MFPLRYFNPRYWASRYWPKVGGIPIVITPDCYTILSAPINDCPEILIGPITEYTLLSSKITEYKILQGKITEYTILEGGLCCGSTH